MGWRQCQEGTKAVGMSTMVNIIEGTLCKKVICDFLLKALRPQEAELAPEKFHNRICGHYLGSAVFTNNSLRLVYAEYVG